MSLKKSPTFDVSFKCQQCGMIFGSEESLVKHQDKFCIGVPDSGLNRDDVSYDEQSIQLDAQNDKTGNGTFYIETPKSQPTSRLQTRETNERPVVTEKKVINDIENWKTQKSIEQSVKDMEDLIVRDTLRDKQLVDTLKAEDRLDDDLLSRKPNADPYKTLMKEYSELKKKEKKVLKEIYELRPKPGQETTKANKDESIFFDVINDFRVNEPLASDAMVMNNNNDYPFAKKSSREEMESEYYFNNIQDTQTKSYLRDIQDKTQTLERERREIEKKLEQLRRENENILTNTSKQSINTILEELKNQEKTNEAALEILKRRLLESSRKSTDSIRRIESLTNNYNTQFVIPPIAPPKNGINSMDRMNSEEIRALRLNYLRSGGHDANVLSNFAEMEYKTRPLFDTTPLNTNYNSDSIKDMTQNLEEKLSKIQTDNKRLQYDLELVKNKFRNLNNVNGDFARVRDDYDQHLNFVKQLLQKYDRPADLTLPPIVGNTRNSYNNEFLHSVTESYTAAPLHTVSHVPSPYSTQRSQHQHHHQQIMNARMQPQPENNFHMNNMHANMMQPQQKAPELFTQMRELNSGPYDPIGGFVIFIDFISNLDVSHASTRIITCLHHPKSGLGEPSVLPTASCESYVDNGASSTVALVSTKQPVPRCPPQQALTIIIELQISTKDDPKLKSTAWTKIPLFDFRNRLLSGRWRIPLKVLPIKSELNMAAINQIPKFGRTEIFYRLVNVKDAPEQTNVPISPSNADYYTYPPQDDYEDPYSTVNQQNQYQNSLLKKSPNARQMNQPLQLPQQDYIQNANTNSNQRFNANSYNSINSNESQPRKTVQINSKPTSRGSTRIPNQNTIGSYQSPLNTKRGTFRN